MTDGLNTSVLTKCGLVKCASPGCATGATERITLDKSTQLAMAALGVSDLAGLKQALKARASAIAGLAGEPPTEDLAVQIRSAIKAGKALQRDLAALKQKIGLESARLAQLKAAFVTGLGAAPVRRVDFRG
jgi:hypothetical protein